MQITLNFGTTGLPVNLPDSWNITIAGKKAMPVLADPAAAVQQALDAPAPLPDASGSCPPLRELARGKQSVCILICDVTRPVPNSTLLQPILHTLAEAGVPEEAVTILVATGLHRPNEGEELVALVGSRDIVERYHVVNHFAGRDEDHVFLPPTSTGTPVGLDKRFVQADLRIVTGLVEPHFMAGYSGGRKVIAPGICHESTIRTFHNARIMGDPRAANLNLKGNPLHAEQMEIVSRLAPVYAVNTVIDDERRLSFINFGEIASSHEQAVAHAAPYFRYDLPRRFTTVITCAAGAPLDLNFYQTVKGLVGAKEALKTGGRIFIASECREGLGSQEFQDCQKRLVANGWKAFLEDIGTRNRANADEWETQKLTEILAVGAATLYAPLLSAEERALTGIDYTDHFEDSIRNWVEQTGDADVLVIPEGPYVIPVAPTAG